MAKQGFSGAARALVDRRSAIVQGWLSAYADSKLRIPRPMDARELQGLAEALAEELAVALSEGDVVPGAPGLREAEKRVAFAAGCLGMAGASVFDVVAFVLALRTVLVVAAADEEERAQLGSLFDWFCALSAEGYTSSREDALRLSHRESLEKGTPVVLIAPGVPAALLVGDPDRAVLESTFGRLLLAVVRVDARVVIIDGAGLGRDHAPVVLEALATFGSHSKVRGRLTVIGSGLSAEAETGWATALGPDVVWRTAGRFDDAVALGLAVAGFGITKGGHS